MKVFPTVVPLGLAAVYIWREREELKLTGSRLRTSDDFAAPSSLKPITKLDSASHSTSLHVITRVPEFYSPM